MTDYRVGFFAIIIGLLLMVGCARPLDVAVHTANAAATGLSAASDVLSQQYEADQVAAVEAGGGKPQVMVVRKKYDDAWKAYDVAWHAWASAVSAIDFARRAKRQDLDNLPSLLSDLAQAYRDALTATYLATGKRP